MNTVFFSYMDKSLQICINISLILRSCIVYEYFNAFKLGELIIFSYIALKMKGKSQAHEEPCCHLLRRLD